MQQCQWIIRDKPNNNLTDSESFKSKIKITGSNPAECNTKNVEIAVPLKYLSNFRRALKILLINCEIKLILTQSSNCVIRDSSGVGTYGITDARLYVPTLSTQNNAELLQQLKSVLKEQLTVKNIT